jgi:hypothetical protein
MKKKIIISYFPPGMKYITPLLFGAAIYLIIINYAVWGILLTLSGLIILTTNYVTAIDLQEKKYDDYLSLLGVPLNSESQHFKNVDCIVITKGNYAQTVNTRIQSRQMDWSDYTGTLIMDSDKTLDLLTRNNKKELIKELLEFAIFLQVGIEDRTTSEYYWVDLEKI